LSEERTRIEEFEVTGEKVVQTVKELVHQGNIRRISIRDADGRTVIEIPLTLGVVGAMVLPAWAALGALAALLVKCTIVVERIDE
jgi:hypothetical protein